MALAFWVIGAEGGGNQAPLDQHLQNSKIACPRVNKVVQDCLEMSHFRAKEE